MRARERQRKGATQQGTNTMIVLQINSRLAKPPLRCRMYVGNTWQRETHFSDPQPFSNPINLRAHLASSLPLPPATVTATVAITIATTTVVTGRRRGCTHLIHVRVLLMCYHYQRVGNYHHSATTSDRPALPLFTLT